MDKRIYDLLAKEDLTSGPASISVPTKIDLKNPSNISVLELAQEQGLISYGYISETIFVKATEKWWEKKAEHERDLREEELKKIAEKSLKESATSNRIAWIAIMVSIGTLLITIVSFLFK